MTRNRLIMLAAGGSAAMLLAAWGFQYLGGMAPCKLCIWQRYPHGAAALIGALALASGWRILPWGGALAALSTGGIGLYHAGVEQGWWEGPTTCTSGPIGNLSAEQLMAQILEAPLVRCDDIPWELFGISMAGWNGVISIGLALIWLLAATRRA